MPSPEWCPRVMVSCGVDLRQWSGAPIFVPLPGLGVVSLPTYTTGRGLFSDVVDALCGRSAPPGQSVAEFADVALAVPIPGSPPWSAGIDADDRVFLEAAAAFEVQAASSWGFVAAVTAAVAVGGGRWRATAQADWLRGNVHQRLGVRVAAPAPWDFVPDLARVQSIPVALRSSALTDADAVPQALTIQGADVAADPAHSPHRWGIDATGRVWRSTQGLGFLGIVADFAARLGFARGWTTTVVGALTVQTALDPCPGVLCPSRPPPEPMIRGTDLRVAATRALSGLVRRVERGQAQTWVVQLLLDGLQDDWDDLWDHYLRRWVPYQSRRVVVYQDLGETRRRGALEDAQAYDLVRTVQGGGRWGRVVCVLDEAHDAAQALEAQAGLYRRAPLALRLVEVP